MGNNPRVTVGVPRFAFLCLVLSILVFVRPGSDADAALVTPGWATGASPAASFGQQIQSDVKYAGQQCGDNSVLLFRIRGSGASYGNGPGGGRDALGAWSVAAGNALIARGWRVSDMQAKYDAPAIPFGSIGKAFAQLPLPAALVSSAAQLKAYRDVPTNQTSDIASQLLEAANRCSSRKIVLAGYSQGGIVMRYLVRQLPRQLRDRIIRVSLIADPTADERVDGYRLSHSGSPGARATSAGIDTYLNKSNPWFRQAAYPADLAVRVTQICVPYDVVCDTNPVNLAPTNWPSEGARHASYKWGEIGKSAVSSMRSWSVGPSKLPDPTSQALGPGVTQVASKRTGATSQWKHASGFAPGESAWVLSTGIAEEAVNRPPSFQASTGLSGAGNARLSALIGGKATHDAASYTAVVKTTGNTLHIRYVFGSEEYPEYVGSAYDDVMAIFVNGNNCAVVPGTNDRISVNSVNHLTNSGLYVDNSSGAAGYHSSLDGLTVPLQCNIPVTPGKQVTVEIAIADAGDDVYDSAVAIVDDGIWSD